MGPRTRQFHAIYINGPHAPNDEIKRYLEGRDRFGGLAERAGQSLLWMPPEFLRLHPPEWSEFEQYLGTRQFRMLGPADADGQPTVQITQRIYDAILPPGSTFADRWVTYLHWMAWRGGDGMPVRAKRKTWRGNAVFPWTSSLAEHELMMEGMPPPLRADFASTRHFFSVVEDLFLTSALAINVLASRIAELFANTPVQENPATCSHSEPPSNPPIPPAAAAPVDLPPANPIVPGFVRTKVVVSYSHRDTAFLERLQVHLGPLERQGLIEVWNDTRIQTGQIWREEIRKAINSAKIAVLLVSADFLASEFIAQNELPTLLAAAKEDGALILPVILKPCAFATTSGLCEFQAVNSPADPLSGMGHHRREAIWNQLVCDIQKRLSGNREN